jgi:putative OPT family oligopeptide transporter
VSDAPAPSLRELSFRGFALGALITIVFTAANIYLGLKVGLTFASSIPAAVISMAILRIVGGSNILENNIVQTIASAAGTLSSIIFVLPGLVMVGYWTGFPFWQTAGICAAGGVLGVMFTVPLRRAMVVESDLPYPEGVAAAAILKVGSADLEPAGDRDAARQPGLADVIAGTGISAAFAMVSTGFGLFASELNGVFRVGSLLTGIGIDLSPALLGVGYLVGLTVGLAMFIGVAIAWAGAMPILTALHPVPPDAHIAAYATGIWRTQVRLIGAGAIGVAAVWTLIQLARPMVRGIRASLAALAAIRSGQGAAIDRTERDLPFDIVAGVSLALMIPIGLIFADFIGAAHVFDTGQIILLVISATLFSFLIGFVVATACGYMAGLIGSSNSPISGIGIIAVVLSGLMLTALLGHSLTDPRIQKQGIALALFVTAVVLAIATISNDNLQDLKTGQLVGASPWRQQLALVAGVIVGAAVIPPILELVYQAYGFAGAPLARPDMDPSRALAAPQAALMSALATGILSGQLDWTMIGIGAVLGVALVVIDEVLRHAGGRARLPPLAVGLGIYLPAAVTIPVSVGALVAWLADRVLRRRAERANLPFDAVAELPRRRGVLLASGLIVGESIFGVVLAALIVGSGSQEPLALVGQNFAPVAAWLGGMAFLLVSADLYRRISAGGSPSG